MKEIHGGDIYRNHVDLDFSINVNPLGMPWNVREALEEAVNNCGKYPDIKSEKLKKAVGKMLGVPENYLILGNGASELFMAIVHAVRPKKTVIPVPSFYGYKYAAEAVDSEITYYETKQENSFSLTDDIYSVLTADVDLLFLANPNNPTGCQIKKEFLKSLLRYCQKRKICVVLDECFIEFCGEEFSMLSDMKTFENLVLVRAFTKIFAVPGVRLGYLICANQSMRELISRQLPEWNLSCFAQAAGIACAAQKDFIKETVSYVKKERQFLEANLKQMRIQVFSGAADFLFLYSEIDLYEKLLEKGILIRDCQNFQGLTKGFYRIAVRSREENIKLMKTLGEIVDNEYRTCTSRRN